MDTPIRLPLRQRSRGLMLACPDPAGLELAALEHWHQQGLELWRSQTGEPPPPDCENARFSWLSVKLELARRLLTQCNYCVHDCRVNRLAGETGYCGLDGRPWISGSYLHCGEEAPLNPTWAVFFSGCTMHCTYCHNWRETFDLSAGSTLEPVELATRLLAEKGRYRTLSLIGGTPEPQLHAVLALAAALDDAVDVPLVFNNNATLSRIGLELMEGVVDIYLPDFKHGNDTCAWKLTKIGAYLESIRTNLRAYLDQGTGLLVRHLVVPGHLECCTRPVLNTLAAEFPGVAVNIMFQYRPMYQAATKAGLDRILTPAEKRQVAGWVKELELRQVE